MDENKLKELYKMLDEQLTTYEDYDNNQEVDQAIVSLKDEIENFLMEHDIEL